MGTSSHATKIGVKPFDTPWTKTHTASKFHSSIFYRTRLIARQVLHSGKRNFVLLCPWPWSNDLQMWIWLGSQAFLSSGPASSNTLPAYLYLPSVSGLLPKTSEDISVICLVGIVDTCAFVTILINCCGSEMAIYYLLRIPRRCTRRRKMNILCQSFRNLYYIQTYRGYIQT